jgi:methyltransferase (TIGR00027 family)
MNRSSRTAEHMAFFRALESRRPPRQRLFNDPCAACFLSPGFRKALRVASIPGLGRAVPWLADIVIPGARSSGIARTRWIDDALVAALAKNIRQVVILGAGFDCRAFRIPELRAAKIFEVDHPQTFATKRAHLAQFIEGEPTNLSFVQIDFNRQSLEQVLRQAGFDPAERSIFLWEGVTNYLTADAVTAVLRFIASCAAGTELIFTYVHRSALDHPASFSDAEKLLRSLEKIGEPWTFGLLPEEVSAFLQGTGLRLRQDVGSCDYRAQFMGPRGRHMKGYEFYRVAVADVPAPQDRNLAASPAQIADAVR